MEKESVNRKIEKNIQNVSQTEKVVEVLRMRMNKMEESEQLICLSDVTKEMHSSSRRESVCEELVSKNISNVLKNKSLFQKMEKC